MGRRNQRAEHVPLDLTSVTFEPDKPLSTRAWPVKDPYFERIDRERAAAERQAEARRRNGIDWTICLVPGCGRDVDEDWLAPREEPKEPRNTERFLPMCHFHLVLVWERVQRDRNDPAFLEAGQERKRQQIALHVAREQAEDRAFRARQDGQMYFVRVNHLVKVGWTRDLHRRLKEYGAGAQLLCHYPAKLQDEPLLHKQLKAELAKGREWCHDGPVIQLFVANAVKQYGGPTVKADWTEPRPPVIRQRSRR